MTIKDIAKQCGVSVSTVSRVLNNRPDVSEAVRPRVLAVVEAESYIPNNSAQVTVSMFGRETSVDFELDQLEKVKD